MTKTRLVKKVYPKTGYIAFAYNGGLLEMFINRDIAKTIVVGDMITFTEEGDYVKVTNNRTGETW